MRVKEENTTQEWVSSQTIDPKVNFRTLQGWISKDIVPRADQLYSLATVLNTTVEYLVDGDAGTEYLKRHFSIDSPGTGLYVAEEAPRYGQKDTIHRDIDRLSEQDREEIKALVSIKLARAQNKTRHA